MRVKWLNHLEVLLHMEEVEGRGWGGRGFLGRRRRRRGREGRRRELLMTLFSRLGFFSEDR